MTKKKARPSESLVTVVTTVMMSYTHIFEVSLVLPVLMITIALLEAIVRPIRAAIARSFVWKDLHREIVADFKARAVQGLILIWVTSAIERHAHLTQ